MAIAPRMIAPVQGVPVMRDGQQAGIAPTGYAPGTVVQLLGQQLMQPPPPPPPPPLPPELFLPVQDDTGDVGEQETNAANAQASGTGNIGIDFGLPSGFTDPVVDLGLGPFNPTPMGLGLSALGLAVPGLAPVGLAYSAVNALSDLVGPAEVNSLGQTQQFGYGNQNIDMFGNPVGSPENIASIMSFDMETNEFTSPTTGEKMSPAPSPDISVDLSTPENISFAADQTQMADPTETYGDQFGESTSDGTGGDGKVICGEMHRQGRISTPVYEADQEFGQHMRETDPYVMDGYLAWANTVVRLMQKSCVFSWFVALFAKPWAREMYRREAGRGRGSLAGKVMMKVGIPLCRFIGKRNARGWLPPFKRHTHA